jgi:hypothetical protein
VNSVPPRSEAELLAQVRAQVGAWLEGSSLSPRFEAKLPAAFAWTVTCSPRDADGDQIALAAMDLLLWFLQLDDYAGADYVSFFRRCAEAMAQAAAPMPGPGPQAELLALFVAQRDRVAAFGRPMERYLHEREQALREYAARNDARERGELPSVETFLARRSTTILFRAWFSLWEILADFQLDDAAYHSTCFERAMRAEIRWQIQQNELHSVERDLEEGTPNLVALLMNERGWSQAQVVAELGRSCDALVEEIALARRELAATGGDRGRMRAAFDFLELNIEGSRALYARALARYAKAEL